MLVKESALYGACVIFEVLFFQGMKEWVMEVLEMEDILSKLNGFWVLYFILDVTFPWKWGIVYET